MRTLLLTALLLGAAPVAPGVHAAAPSEEATAPADRQPRATVELFADQAAVVPGRPLTLALRFRIERGWHIYWRNPGESGMAPSVKWRLPPGFRAGPLRFPPPRRERSPVGDSYVLDGEPVLLVDLDVPESLSPGQSIEIAGLAQWLVCREACVLEKQELSLKLPVDDRNAPSRPANESLFRRARRLLPVPAAEAQYLTFTTAANVDRLRPKDRAKIALVLAVKDGFHIQSNKPLAPGFIATDVFTDIVPGLTIGEPVFPPARRTTVPDLGEVAEFAGRVVIVIPIEANPDLKGPVVRVTGVLTYQACDDKTGQCFMPTNVEWGITIPVGDKDAIVKPIHGDIFAAAASAPTPQGRTSFEDGPARGFSLDRPIQAQLHEARHPLWIWLILAAIAGLVLNITPCVLPVISIKIISFVQQAQASPGRVFKLGLAFAAGMLIVFNVLAGLATGANLVWGQHFQNSTFVLVMTAIIFAFGLSLFGVFTLGVPRAIEEAAGRRADEGYLGSLAKGALATALGTPCLGPVLGSVLTWAVTQPTGIVFLVFNTIGVGMAAPYVVLTANPRWLRFVPRPGPWMETFKHIMGFVLMATVVYLLGILLGQIGGAGLVLALAFLVAVAFACWLWGRYVSLTSTPGVRMAVRLISVAIVVVAWLGFIRPSGGRPLPQTQPSHTSLPDNASGGMKWQEFSLQRLQELTAQGKTVMVDVSAEWCLNCKLNLKFVLDTPTVVREVERLGVVPMVADWTGYDEQIGRFIQKLAPGASIPLLAIFPAGRPEQPIVMLGIVTQTQVLQALAQAGPSRP